jgi:hypothetical protein
MRTSHLGRHFVQNDEGSLEDIADVQVGPEDEQLQLLAQVHDVDEAASA